MDHDEEERGGMQALVEEIFEFSREGSKNKIKTALVAIFVILVLYGKLKKYGLIGKRDLTSGRASAFDERIDQGFDLSKLRLDAPAQDTNSTEDSNQVGNENTGINPPDTLVEDNPYIQPGLDVAFDQGVDKHHWQSATRAPPVITNLDSRANRLKAGNLTAEDEELFRRVLSMGTDTRDLDVKDEKADEEEEKRRRRLRDEKEHPEIKFMRIFNVEPWNLKSQMTLLKKQRVTFLKTATKEVTHLKKNVESLQNYLVQTNPEFAAKLEQQKAMAANIARMQEALAKRAV